MEDEGIVNSSPVDNTSPFYKAITKPRENSAKNTINQSSTNIHYNSGIGDSKFDEGLRWGIDVNENDPIKSINEYRAVNQPWYDKTAAGIGRIGVKVAAEIAKMPGYIVGAAIAPFAKEGEGWDIAVNNQWIKSINNLNQDINNDILPVYVKKAVSEGNLWDNISSIDFWATDGADGIGYIGAMMLPGAAFNTLGLGEKALGLTAKGLALVNGESKLAGATAKLAQLGITAEKIDVGGAALANTLLESGSEAGSAMDNFEKDLKRRFDSGEIDQHQYEELSKQKGELGRDIFLSNLAILAGPNLIQAKMLWGKAGNKFLSKLENPNLLSKIGARSKDIVEAGLSEGVWEEAGQSTVENMFTNKAKKGELKGKSLFGYLNDFNVGELTNSYFDTISTTEGQKAMFLGAFLGGGMAAYHGAKSDVANRTNTNDILESSQQTVDNFNKIKETDIYKRDTKGDIMFNYNNKPQLDPVKVIEVAKALNYTDQKSKQFDEAVKNGDSEVVDELKQQAVTQLITPYITKGELGVEALEQHLTELSKSEDFSQDPKLVEVNKKFIKDAVEQAKYMQSQYQSYLDFSNNLINLNHPDAIPDQKVDFYNQLASTYITYKGIEFSEKKKLSNLNTEKSKLLKDIKEPTTTSDLNPEFIEGKTEDIYKNNREETDPRLKLLNDKINSTKDKLSFINELVNNTIWDSEKVNKAFAKKVEENRDITNKTNPQVQEELDNTFDKIKEAVSEKELEDIKTDNPQVQDAVEKKKEVIKTAEIQKDQIIEENNQLLADVFREEGLSETKLQPQKEISIDGNENTIEQDEPVGFSDNIQSLNKEVKQSQPGAKVISTDTKGIKLPFITEEYLEYERTPRDKSKDKVGFEIVDYKGDNENWNKAIQMVNNKDFSNKEFLYNHLPINAWFTNKEREDKLIDPIEAPIETITKSVEANKIFKKETLPLRKAIVDALVNGQDLDDLSSNIVKQFPGQLKVKDQIVMEDGTLRTPENSILDLQIFQGMSRLDIIKNIAKRAYYVDYDGILTNVINKENKKGNYHKGQGEIFLEIPQNNGKPYMLKLNFKRIDEDKAEAIYEIVKVLSTSAKTIDNPTGQLVPIENFISSLPEEIIMKVAYALTSEIALVEKLYPDNATLDKLLDILVFQKSENQKTLFKLDDFGNLKLGSIADISNINKEDLLNDTHKDTILNFLNKKRHNVLVTKKGFGDATQFQFNNPDYVNYLLDNNILTTNAVVNEPTFQGYSNIYINREIKGINKIKSSDKLTKQQIEEFKEVEFIIENSFNPKTQEDIKVDTEFDFEKLDNKSKAILIVKLSNELNVQLSNEMREKLATNSREIYDFLIEKAKKKNKNIDNLVKRCI